MKRSSNSILEQGLEGAYMKQISYMNKFDEPSQHLFDEDDYQKDGHVTLKKNASDLSHLGPITSLRQVARNSLLKKEASDLSHLGPITSLKQIGRNSILGMPKTKSSLIFNNK